MTHQGSTIRRLTDTDISTILSKEALDSLKNRTKGGQSSYKGYSYEEIFGAHRISRLARKLIENGEDAEVEWQSDSFVDDFVVRRDSACSFKGYQLKNTDQVSWTAGSPSIELDFQRQNTCSAKEGYSDIRLRLVCSNRDRVQTLSKTLPEAIAEYSKAIYFPYEVPFLALLEDNAWLAEDFGWLSKHPDHKPIDMSELAAVLMGAWAILAPSATVSSILDKARCMSPNLVRPLQSDEEAETMLSRECREVLLSLPRFEFKIERGFLHWSFANGITKGVLSQDCFSEAFQKFQKCVLDLNPSSFEEIEGELR